LRIHNATRDAEIAGHASAARSYWSRLIGLLGRSSLRPGEALLLDPCTSVHTAFMRFSIDVAFLDREARVVKIVPAMGPFRASAVLRGGRSAVELPKGTLERTGTAVGDQLLFES